MSDIETSSKPTSSWKRRAAIGALVIGTLTAAGAFAIAGDRPDGGFGPMGGHHGMMNKVKGGFMEYRMERALDSVDATDDQKQKIKTIFEKARENVTDLRGDRGKMRDDMKALLEKPVIDRDAAEAMRKARIEKMDEASKIMTTAMLDAADVLTPDQRVKLAKEIGSHRPRW